MKATLTVLGSGTSMGVPTIGCDCAVCHSPDPRDRRTRPSILIEYSGRVVLIDTTPDFREQAIREGITKLDAVLYTHTHADYIFQADYKFGGIAELELKEIDGPIDLFGARFEPVKVVHGETEIYGYRMGAAAYLTDFSDIPESSFSQLEELDILFLDALRHKPHPTHSTVENSLRIVNRLKPKRAFFTHICHDLPHEATNATLPPNVRLSHDGLKMEFEI
jgi:phosphoribosyl 1,2-cyclic phosphate phosphodiesterase